MVFEYLGNTGTTAVQLFATDGHNACRASVLRSSPVYNVHGPIWWSFSKAIAALVSVVFCHSSWVFTPWRRRWSPGDSRWDSFHWLQRTFGAVSDLHSCLWTCCCSHLSGWVELVVFCSVLQVSNLEYPVCVPNLKFSIMTWKQSSRQIWFVFSNPESTKSFKCSYGWNRKISSINFTHTLHWWYFDLGASENKKWVWVLQSLTLHSTTQDSMNIGSNNEDRRPEHSLGFFIFVVAIRRFSQVHWSSIVVAQVWGVLSQCCSCMCFRCDLFLVNHCVSSKDRSHSRWMTPLSFVVRCEL